MVSASGALTRVHSTDYIRTLEHVIRFAEEETPRLNGAKRAREQPLLHTPPPNDQRPILKRSQRIRPGEWTPYRLVVPQTDDESSRSSVVTHVSATPPPQQEEKGVEGEIEIPPRPSRTNLSLLVDVAIAGTETL